MQFESQVFRALLNLIGCERIRTTAYHPASNGMVERWHRDLKAEIMCQSSGLDWSRTLPMVLLGLPTRIRLNTDASPADFIFGTTLRISGEFCAFGDVETDPQIFLEEFREYIRKVRPVPIVHKHKVKPFVFKDLVTCIHVSLLCKAVKTPLVRPHSGPFKVLSRTSAQTFVIEENGNSKMVELLKPAHYIPEELSEIVAEQLDSNLHSELQPDFSDSNRISDDVANMRVQRCADSELCLSRNNDDVIRTRAQVHADGEIRSCSDSEINNAIPRQKTDVQVTKKKRVKFVLNILRNVNNSKSPN